MIYPSQYIAFHLNLPPEKKEVASGEFHENSDSIQNFEKYR